MKARIRLVEIEHFASQSIDPTFQGDSTQFIALGGKFEYQSLCQPQHLDPNSACLCGDDLFNTHMRQLWERSNHEPALVPCGQVIMRDLAVFGDCGLPIDFSSGLALVGAPINWGIDFARWYLRQSATKLDGMTWDDRQDTFTIEVDYDSIPLEQRDSLLLASPGQHIFGHWILDYVPRLFLAQGMNQKYRNSTYFGEVPKWAQYFLHVFGIHTSTIKILPSRPLTRFSCVAMPSGLKQGFRISQPINELAWRRLKSFTDGVKIESNLEIPKAPRVFISRRGWGTQRVISNLARLEEMAVDRGYVLIHPEDYPIPAQAQIMRSARIVLGEDGSGLHNIVFADSGCVLGVISMPDRPNLWHMAISQAMGHRISYVGADLHPGGIRIVEEASYSAFLDRLEQIVSWSGS